MEREKRVRSHCYCHVPMDALEKFLEDFHDEKIALTTDEIRLEFGFEGAVVFDDTAVAYPRDC